MVTKVISVSDKLPFSQLLYFEKSTKLDALHDYFETENYQNLKLPN